MLGAAWYAVTLYAYSNGNPRKMDAVELQARLSHDLGPTAVELEVSATPEQARRDNIYFGLSSRTPLGPAGLSASLHGGYEDGYFRHKLDREAGVHYVRAHWTLSASVLGFSTDADPSSLAVQPEKRGGTGTRGKTTAVIALVRSFRAEADMRSAY